MEVLNVHCPTCGAPLGRAYSGSRIEMKCPKCACQLLYAVGDNSAQYTITKPSPKHKVESVTTCART